MKILYFLEPEEELGSPLFRMGTVRNHLDSEIRAIRSGRESVDVRIVCSEAIANESRTGGWLNGVPMTVVAQPELREIYPDYRSASAHWYNGTYSHAALDRAVALYRDKLGDCDPDVIVCYESNAPFLARLFPRALFLHSTLGLFSRAPYPETSCLDPFGVGKDSYLCRFENELRTLQVDAAGEQRVADLKERYRRALIDHSPVRRDAVRQGWSHVVLLPLQVSNYFMFDDNLPDRVHFENQLEFVRYVLERIDPQVAVFVTMHGASADLMRPDVLESLKRAHPNFLYSESLQKVRWVSQHLLPHVDGVITVSSSVGLQAMIWDLPVVALGRSQIGGIADGTTVEDMTALVSQGARPEKAAQLHHLLTRYYPLLSRYHHDPEWYRAFLERSIERKHGGAGFDFFDPIDDADRVFEALSSDLRTGKMVEEVRKTASHLIGTIGSPMADATRRMADADIVCFDVFDTLITRPLTHHTGVLLLVESEVARTLGDSVAAELALAGGYSDVRRRAADRAMRGAKEAGLQEISMEAICREMASESPLSTTTCRALLDLELDVERRIQRPRHLGVRLFEAARRMGKRTVLISDMYFDRVFVEELLGAAGVRGYDEIYVSSEHGVLKRTGDLFDKVRSEQGQDARYLHIGDNLVSDVHVAERKGFSTFHLENPTDRYQGTAANRQLWPRSGFQQRLGSMVHHGVISRKFVDDEVSDTSWFSGSPYRLGYEAGGPVFLAFVQWLVQSALRDRTERLYFLARDGFIVKQIYDMAREARSDLPESRYLLASRRAYSTAALTSVQDISDSLELKFSPVSLRDFVLHRYGLAEHEITEASWTRAGFRDLDERVDGRKRADVERLREFLEHNSEQILAHAAEERESLLQHFHEEMLDASGRRAVVDIGHNASLQEAVGRLLRDRSIAGYYFATFFGAKRVYNMGHPVSGFLLDFEESEGNSHPYCRNIGMFEFLFLPAVPSFARFRREGDHILPEYVGGDESARFSLISEVHRGVIDFCRDALTACGGRIELFDIPKTEALRRYIAFATKPHVADARLFAGVSFVDAFGGNTARYLIATPLHPRITAANVDDFLRDSWWRSGARALLDGPTKDAAGAWGRDGTPVGKMRRKLRKMVESPQQFVLDLAILRPLVGTNGSALLADGHGLTSKQRKLRKLIVDPKRFVLDIRALAPYRGGIGEVFDAVSVDPSRTEPGSLARKLQKMRRSPREFVRDLLILRQMRRGGSSQGES